jgi:DNA repair exonuclease SbcCD ATPase subunit
VRRDRAAAEARAAWTIELAAADARVVRLRAAQGRVRALEREGARRRLAAADGRLQGARDALREALEELGAALAALAAAEQTRRGVASFLDERARVWAPQAAETRALRAAWAQWGPWQARVRALEAEHIASQLAEARERLKVAASAGAVRARAEGLRRAVADGPGAHGAWAAACAELAAAAGRARVLDEELGGARTKAAARAEDEAMAAELAAYAAALQSRLQDIRMLNVYMDGFRAWLYTNVVAPLLEREVNCALALLQAQGAQARQLALVVSWKDNGTFGWGFRDGALPTALPLGKASGFQRASIGLCMRIALARVGCMGIVSRHLFIDEGFTASDSDNMACVPQFLRALLAARYDTVLLVSHIEGIKDCADVVVPITRFTNERGVALSRLQFGERPTGALAIQAKQRGRPPGPTATARRVGG